MRFHNVHHQYFWNFIISWDYIIVLIFCCKKVKRERMSCYDHLLCLCGLSKRQANGKQTWTLSYIFSLISEHKLTFFCLGLMNNGLHQYFWDFASPTQQMAARHEHCPTKRQKDKHIKDKKKEEKRDKRTKTQKTKTQANCSQTRTIFHSARNKYWTWPNFFCRGLHTF